MSDEFDADAYMAEQEAEAAAMAVNPDVPADDFEDEPADPEIVAAMLNPEHLAGQVEERNRTMVSLNDIILTLTPMMNAFLEKERQLMEQHREALTEALVSRESSGEKVVDALESGMPPPPAMAQLPDGIGMDLEQVARLLAEKSKTVVSADDPILMVVTILNAFLAEENKLMARHRKALTELFASRLDEYVKGVRATSDELGHFLASSTLAAQQKMFTGHRSTMIWTAAIVTVSALVNVAVFVLR